MVEEYPSVFLVCVCLKQTWSTNTKGESITLQYDTIRAQLMKQHWRTNWKIR